MKIADLAFLGRVGNQSFVPPSFADIVLWIKPESLSALSDNDPVSTWPDSGSQGNDLNNASGVEPTYKLNEINGQPGVRFDGVDDRLDVSGVGSTSTEYTIFIVLKFDAAAGTQGVLRLGENGGYGFLKDTGSREVLHRNVAACMDSGATTSAELWSAVRTSAPLLRFFVNGGSVAVTNSTSACLAPDGTIHCGRFSAAGLYFDGVICEALIYEVALSDSDRQTVENYLKSKYGL